MRRMVVGIMAASRVARRSHLKCSAGLISGFCKPAWVGAVDVHMGWRGGASVPDHFDPRRPAGYERGVTAETVSQLCQQGQLIEAVEALGVLVNTRCRITQPLFHMVLRKCAGQRDLVLGRRVHALTVKGGNESDTFLCNHILRMYAAHARLQEAMDVFALVARPDAFTWSAIISAHVKYGHDKEAIELYRRMPTSGIKPDGHVFVAALQACARAADLKTGQEVHARVLDSGIKPDLFLCNTLVDMYAKCGLLEEAQRVFDGIVDKNVVTWNTLIAGYSQQSRGQEALGLYRAMQEEGIVTPDSVTFVSLLQACATVDPAALEEGKQLHSQLTERGFQADVFVASSLVNMYAKCGSLADAREVFDGLSHKEVTTWNAMIAGYSQQGMGQEALSLCTSMREEGVIVPNSVTFVCLLQACASVGNVGLKEGKQLHAHIRERGLQSDVCVASSLVNMYAKCGSLEDARGVFDGLVEKNVVTWTALIAGYSEQGMGLEALSLHSAMQEEGMAAPNPVTCVCLLQACASVGAPALEKGKQLHAQMGEQGRQADVSVANSLVNMYAKCGSLEDAQRVFDGLPHKNMVTWNAMIAGYSQQGKGQEALRLYFAMQHEGISAPDPVTFVSLLQACASVGNPALEKGKQLHAQIRERDLQADVFVASSLVNMYAKCGSLEDARAVFDRLEQKNVVTWSSMIAGYSQQGMGQEALALYKAMQEEGLVAPNSVTFVCLLQACANLAALHLGRQLHAHIREQGLQADALVASGLINMYGKSGSMIDAQLVFKALPERDVVTWNALISGYTRQGDSQMVFDLFDRMREDGIQPVGITFLCLLTVCSHSGLVHKGQELFEAMSRHYGITPTVEHYSCMVDLLGRAGRVEEALTRGRTMPVLPTVGVWHNLLGACRKWNNVEVGRHAFDEAVKLDSKDPAAYVSMSNIYIDAQMWEQAEEMQARRKVCGAWKQPGQSWWTDMEGLVHSFLVGDTIHPESGGIYARLQLLFSKIKNESCVLESSIDDGKEQHLLGRTPRVVPKVPHVVSSVIQ